MFDTSDSEMALASLTAQAETQLASWDNQNLSGFNELFSVPVDFHGQRVKTTSFLALDSAAHVGTQFLSLLSLVGLSEVSESTIATMPPAQVNPLNLSSVLMPVSTFLSAQLVSTVTTDSSALARPVAWQSAFAMSLENWSAIAQVRVIPSYIEAKDATLTNELLARCTDLPTTSQVKVVNDPNSFPRFRIWFKNHAIGDVSDAVQAENLAQQLRSLLRRDDLDPTLIQPDLSSTPPTIKLGNEILLTIEDEMAEAFGYLAPWMAVAWANNLRKAMGAFPLDVGSVQMALYGYKTSDQGLQGIASWYGPYFHGRLTATGEIFDQNELTVAHKTLPFDTILRVRNRQNGRTVVVRVNDRGPYIGQRSLDLSRAAAQCLGSEKKGIIPYDAEILKQVETDETLALAVPTS